MSSAHSENWFVVCCKPRQESVAEENLLRQGFSVYLPHIKCRKRRRGQWTDVVEPLFPRYLFLRFNPALRSAIPVRSTRGVVGLVRFGGKMAFVPDSVVEALIRRQDADTGLHEDSRPEFSQGELVRLIDGPLEGIEGIYAAPDGDTRVVILLELLGKANKVSIRRDWIARAA
jgi:transcriptional antiterminator RfaH